MNTFRLCAATAALVLTATLVSAQPNSAASAAASASFPGHGPGMRPGGMAPGAMGPTAGMGSRHGVGPGIAASGPVAGRGRMGPGTAGMHGRAGSEFTPGWAMMTPAERQEHQARMQSMGNGAECRAYVEQHRQQMAERARERGLTMPARPRRNACAGLQP